MFKVGTQATLHEAHTHLMSADTVGITERSSYTPPLTILNEEHPMQLCLVPLGNYAFSVLLLSFISPMASTNKMQIIKV